MIAEAFVLHLAELLRLDETVDDVDRCLLRLASVFEHFVLEIDQPLVVIGVGRSLGKTDGSSSSF